MSQVAAVTGAARGIGRAIADALLDAGWRVAAADLSPSPDGRATPFELDVSRFEQVNRFVEQVEEGLGPIELFVNNAGVMTVGPFLLQDEAVIRHEFEVNVFGVVNSMRASLPRMRARGHGHVINIASAAARVGVPGLSTYAATKHAVLGLSEAVRAELRGTGVNVSVVIPNAVATDLATGTRPARGTSWLEPEQVARAVMRLVARPRFVAYIPRRIAIPLALGAALPQTLRDRLAAAMATDRVAFRLAVQGREAYEAELAARAREAR